MKNRLVALILTFLTSVAVAQTSGTSPVDHSEKIDSLMLNDCKVGELARIMTEMTDLSVVASQKASGVEVTVYLKEIPCMTALQSICRSYGLLYKELGGGIIQIITKEEFSDNSGMFNYGFVVTIPVLYPPVEEMCEAVRNVYADRVVWLKPEDNTEEKLEELEGAFERMDQLADRGQADSENGQSSSSSSSSSSNSSRSSSRNSRSSSNYSSSSRSSSSGSSGSSATKPLKLDDEDFDARVVSDSGQADHVRQSGVIFISAMKASNTMLVRSSDQEVVKQIKEIVKNLDRPTPQVLLEVKILSADVTDSQETGVNWLFKDGNFSGGLSTGDLDWSSPGRIVAGAGNYGDTSSAVFNYMTNSMNVRLRLLEEEGKVSTLATPTLLVADNEASRIFTGSSSKFLDSVTPGESTQNENTTVITDPTPVIEEEDIGTSLILTPKIHADRTVTIRVLQDQSAFGDERTVYNYPENDDGDSRGSVQVQDINRQSVVTTVVAKDTNVIVIGGLITEKIVEKETGIPLLKDIPWLGWLFKDQVKSKKKKELIILIRPHVILAPGETQGRSRELLDRVSSSSAVKSIMDGKRATLAFGEVGDKSEVEDEKEDDKESESGVEVIIDDK